MRFQRVIFGRQLHPTWRMMLTLIGAFGFAALIAWGANVWREREAHDDLGPGRIVIQPHGKFR